jgi:DNA-directed RNA polymerase specialized sigma24 family protein
MSSPGSVTHWIGQLKSGERAAAEALWQQYCQRLVARARQRLAGAPRRAADEEDVALSAFDSFYRAAEQGRFARLHDRDDLWQLLVLITDRKAADALRHERRQRRGGGAVLDEAALGRGGSAEGPALADVAAQGPGPELAAQAAEELRRLLAALGDDELRRAALLKMEGHSVEEIAAAVGRVPRTVKRWLRLVRDTWEQELRA